jgi:hypothetical protein
MLSPSILRILDQNHAQLKACVQASSNALDIELWDSSGMRVIELQIAATAELARPSTAARQHSESTSERPFLQELLIATMRTEFKEYLANIIS